MTQEEIGRQIGIRQQVVSEDLAAIKVTYRRDRTEILDREAAELDQMERDCAVEFARTKDREWVAERREIKKRRAAMIGLDAPTRTASTQEIIVKADVGWNDGPGDTGEEIEILETSPET